MAYLKRVLIATVLGIVCGILCWLGGKFFTDMQITPAIAASIILNRAIIGFFIGISGWNIHYLLHGVIIGAIGTLPLAVYGDVSGFFTMVIFGIIWGFLIELFTTKIFKSAMKS